MITNASLNVQSALDWLITSGVQDSEGGFYAWYDAGRKEYSFLYPEVTGYAIQLLIKLHLHDGSQYRAEAVKAGDWLLNNQNNDGSFFCRRFGKLEITPEDNSFYTFDAGVIVCALLDLYKLTLNKKYFASALKTLNLIITLQNPDGSLNAARTWDKRIVCNPHWSQTSSCHHLKLMLPLLKAYKLTSNKKYWTSAKKLLNWGLKLQLPSGRFINFQGTDKTYTHAHCYATEGLLASLKGLDKKTASLIKVRIDKSIEWLFSFQNSDGSFYNWNTPRPERLKVSESLSQALRLFLLTTKHESLQRKIGNSVDFGFSFLKQMQIFGTDKYAHGGISYGMAKDERLRDVSTCATIFALDAALMKEQGQTSPLFEEII